MACPPSPDPVLLVNNWVECIDCLAGELDSVLAHGALTTPRLELYAVQGAPTAKVALIRKHEDSATARLRQWAAGRAGIDSNALLLYTDYYAANYDRQYRVRATIALARIGTPAAHAAIDSAIAHAPTPELLLRLRLARDSAR